MESPLDRLRRIDGKAPAALESRVTKADYFRLPIIQTIWVYLYAQRFLVRVLLLEPLDPTKEDIVILRFFGDVPEPSSTVKSQT